MQEKNRHFVITKRADILFFFFFFLKAGHCLAISPSSFFKSHYLFMVALGLCCCVPAFSSCDDDPGVLSSCGTWASDCGGFSCCGARALGTSASVVATHGL